MPPEVLNKCKSFPSGIVLSILSSDSFYMKAWVSNYFLHIQGMQWAKPLLTTVLIQYASNITL